MGQREASAGSRLAVLIKDFYCELTTMDDLNVVKLGSHTFRFMLEAGRR